MVDGYGLDRSGAEYGLLVHSCENNNEPSVSITCREFLN